MTTESADFDAWTYRRYSCTRDVIADWGDHLKQLRGKCLTSVYAQWDRAIPGPEGWWVNGPVLLNFEGTQLELDAACCEFSVSVDTCRFNLAEVIGDDDESIGVIWREFPWPELERYRGQSLRTLTAVEGHFEELCGFKGVSLEFATGSFCFFDAGDELGISFGPLPNDPTLRWELAHQF